MSREAIIIGAGPTCLTAAFELLERTEIRPLVFEETGDTGGISKTVNYKGNRLDIGGHRFISKSARVMSWWKEILPLEGSLSNCNNKNEGEFVNPEQTDKVMLLRNRRSSILFKQKLFDYPLSFNFKSFSQLGSGTIAKIGASYVKSHIFPIRAETSMGGDLKLSQK